MNQYQLDIIANDEAEVKNFLRKLTIKIKLFWYFFSRPVMSSILRRKLLSLSPSLKSDPVFNRINSFLNGDGGMFKEYVYRISDKMARIRGGRVLVPGIGYGKNLLQLAAFHPKEIVAFDLYEYPEVWTMLKKKLKEEYGVEISFYKGDFDALPDIGQFDLVVSDAVLEHVPDMQKFAMGSMKALRSGGIFYASFGPLWYGPSGDHATWSEEKLFDHILLPKDEYMKQVESTDVSSPSDDSCDTAFMIREGLFSYLHAKDYLDRMDEAGFEILDTKSKVPQNAIRLFENRKDISEALDSKGEPAFDRFSGGMYIWARKP